MNVFYPVLFLFQPFLLIGALGSIVIGSVGALVQVKIKRFIAYTSIAQSGYIIIGISCNSLNGSISAFLYLLMYCFISLCFFCILLNIEHINKGNNIAYLNQLYNIICYNKEISFHLIIIILTMAAIPPLSSFFAKFFIFIICIENKLELITIILLVFSLINTFYYLNLIQQLIFLKFSNFKIYTLNRFFFHLVFLRLSCCFFICSFLILAPIYEYGCYFIIACIRPLSL